jgi:hypothetical protein
MKAIEKAVGIRGLLEKEGLQVKKLVASGSPGFEFTAQVPEVAPRRGSESGGGEQNALERLELLE